MKTIGKITTFIVMIGLIACACVNTAIHIKSGEAKGLFVKSDAQIEAPAETPADAE